jgi:transcriptional regulator with GAF, ATPase, and Fis domain/CHASE2 domain-containing sensor protein
VTSRIRNSGYIHKIFQGDDVKILKNQISFGILLTGILIAVTLVFFSSFRQIDEMTLTAKYNLRGETQLDSSIIVLYLDNNDIRALGGWPLRRNYYALLVNVLKDLGTKAIGLDIGLTEPNKDHPEHDDVLTNIIKNAGNVVLVSNFRSLKHGEPNLTSRPPEKTGYKLSGKVNFLSGENLAVPFPQLLHVCAGVGHENLTNDSRVPLFIRSGNEAFPSFSFELLRVYLGIDNSNVDITKRLALLKSSNNKWTIPLEEDGTVNINFSGGINSLNAIPAVEFLQAYNLYKVGGITDIDVAKVKNKIVIIGLIAEGRSIFLQTPYSQQFPSIGIHAEIIDNALKNNFLKILPLWFEYMIILLFSAAIIFLVVRRNELLSLSIIGIAILFYLTASFIIFIAFGFEIPNARQLFVFIFLSVGLTIYKHRFVRRLMYDLERERDQVTFKLREREKKLLKLEAELKDAELRHASDRTAVLMKEIQKYKDELRMLSAEASDLDSFKADNKKKSETLNFEGIVYSSSSPMFEVIEFVKKIADNDSAVLILGESGTGKELIARAIHNLSKRKNNAFIAVNCGALSETLLESELFGHEKGSFTGAVKEKPGRFELADNGTIFLDEIAETSESFQVKLLRVLQEGEFERVGGTETIKVNVRVVAATNKELLSSSNNKKFRQDLYYRLSVFVINLPPLRERKPDIPILVEYYTNLEHPGMAIGANVMEILKKYDWRGNVREMSSIIKRAVIMAKYDGRDMLRTKDLPDEMHSLIEDNIDIADRILDSLRNKKFSRSSISETAEELGGFNRGTISEYLRGICFKTLVEQDMNVDTAIMLISNSTDREVVERVKKKLLEFIHNAVDIVDKQKQLAENLTKSKPKFKNLPQKYHVYLDTVITEFYKGKLSIPE